jgi:hypothetical protein
MGSAAGLLLCRCRKSTVAPLSFTSGPSCWDPHNMWMGARQRGLYFVGCPLHLYVVCLPWLFTARVSSACVVFSAQGVNQLPLLPEIKDVEEVSAGEWEWMNEWMEGGEPHRQTLYIYHQHTCTYASQSRNSVSACAPPYAMRCFVAGNGRMGWFLSMNKHIYINETEWMKPLSCSSSLREIERKSRHMCGKSAFARASEGWDGNPHLLPVVVYFPRRVWRRQPLHLSHFSTRNGNWPQKREFVIFLSAVRIHCTYASTKAWRIAFCSPCSGQKQFYRQLKPKQINNFFRGGTSLLENKRKECLTEDFLWSIYHFKTFWDADGSIVSIFPYALDYIQFDIFFSWFLKKIKGRYLE